MAAPIAAATAPFPWLSAASLAAGPLLQSLFPKGFGGQSEYGGTDPREYKDELTIDDSELGGIRQGILSDINQTVVQPGVRGIKQAGAAKGLPLGSIASATRGVVSTGAKGVAKAEPGLQKLKHQSMMDFVDRTQRYDYDKGLFDFAQGNQTAAMNQGSLGGLSRLLMMWQAGALDRPDQGG